MKELTHIAGRLFGTPLLIQQQKLDVILSVLAPRLGLNVAHNPIAIQADLMPDESDGSTYCVTNGVAVIPVMGTLVRRSSYLDAMSGLTGYQCIESLFEQAMQDDSVYAVMLDVDSPGGEVGGLFDLVDMIYEARGTKPIWACANESAFSAAYAIASAADKMYLSRTAGVGSIGVIALHVDQSGYDEKMGVKYTAVTAGAKKADLNPHAPLSKEARTELQAEIDRLYSLFTDTVARNRGVSPSDVRKTEAGLYFGSEALPKWADQVGTLEDALNDLTGKLHGSLAQRASAQLNTKEPFMAQRKDADLVAAPQPNAVSAEATDSLVEEVEAEEQDALVAAESAEVAEPVAETEEIVEVPAKELVLASAAPLAADEKARAVRSGYRKATEIVELCALAGRIDLATGLLQKNATAAEARKELLNARIADQPSIQSHVLPDSKATDQLQAIADGIKAQGKCTAEQAMATAIQQNPQLYKQYRDGARR